MAVPRAQDDLFRHVNGSWLDQTPIPDDQASYGAFNELRDDAELAVRAIVEEAAAADAPAGSSRRLIGDLYRSFMDLDLIEGRGAEPARSLIEGIGEIGDIGAFMGRLAGLHRAGVGNAFGLYVDTDPAQPERYTVNLVQSGLGLPDESYYRDEQYADIRTAYVEHVTRMLDLAGVPDAAAQAGQVMALETELAGAHWDRVRTRDKTETFNPMTRTELDALVPAKLWDAWLTGLAAPDGLLDHVVVRHPSFFTALAGLLSDERLPDWKIWLTWNAVHAAAPYCASALVEENFDFYGRTLSGTPALRERWKRGVALVEGAVGEAVGQVYVERHFPPAAKARMDELVANLLRAYSHEITNLTWMSPDTKTRALDKLARFTPKIGYPKHWRDYRTLDIRPDDLMGNVARATAFEVDRELAKIGSAVDRDEWFMTPQTVNAYYNPGMNEIVFPAAILRAPFFDPDADDAVNYGGIGAVIGHEIGHGFDDQGSKIDGTGAQHDWWTPADREAFDALTQKLIAQYSALAPAQVPEHPVNGALTVGENIGDLGGLGIAYQAWRLSLDGAEPPVIDGRTGAQRLFGSWAMIWRFKGRDADVRRRLAIDPHSPPEFRCNQVVRNLDEFYEAFDVTESDQLWLAEADRVRIW